MKKKINNQGFTLIELLVVVLIIGILAAIALPQYKRAVQKAKLSAMLPLMKAVKEANMRYYLLHDTYTNEIDNWDIDLPKITGTYTYGTNRKQIYFKGGSYIEIQDSTLTAGQGPAHVSAFVPNVPAYLWTSYNLSDNPSVGQYRCYALNEDGIPLCRALGCTGSIPVGAGGCGFTYK